jgi:hypothetical protein
MRWHTAIALIAVGSTVSGVADVSVFAQSNTYVARRASASTTIGLHAHPSVLRVYNTDQSPAISSVSLPPNLTFPDSFRQTLESMLARSPTFRRQCLRIQHAHGLLVRVTNLYGGPSRSRAFTRIGSRAAGRLEAHVQIRPLVNLTELLAHELEHVIEQLDGVDLSARSALSGSGVWYVEEGFETTRAVRIGRAVARETNGSR